VLLGTKTETRCSNGGALRADKDGGVKKGNGGNSQWRITPLKENVRCMTECLIILSKDAKVKVKNLVKVIFGGVRQGRPSARDKGNQGAY
jgi:hypothetical protein